MYTETDRATGIWLSYNDTTPPRVVQKIKSVQIYSASILCGALLHKDYWNIFIFSQKWVLRVSQGGSIIKKVDFQDVPNYPMWVL